jgi:DUF4097 and DUF4098 domain-containing protein YvlB
MLEFLGRFWPFMLIAWGAVRLIEILIWTLRRKPLPVNGISGGEWVLVVFLSLVGTGLYTFHTSVGWPPTRIRMRGIEMFGEAFDYTIGEQKAQIGKNRRVILENLRGNTRITGADSTEVIVSGRKTIRSLSRDEADHVDRNTQLEILEQGDALLIRTNQNRAMEERYVTADLEVTIPKGVSIQARGRDGDFEINNLQGGVEIDSDRAGVRVQNLGADLRVNLRRSDLVRAENVQGGVELQGRGNDVELENVQGQVTIDGSWGGELHFRNLAKPVRYQGMQAELQVQKITGDLRLGRGFLNGDSVTGPIVLRGHTKGCCDVRLADFNSSLEIAVQRGDVELRPGVPLPKMDVEVRNGSVDLAIPSNAKFALKAQVSKGDVENDYGDPLRESHESRGGSITGNVGDGPSIAVAMERGRILIRKADDAPPLAPLTPQPPRAPIPPKSDFN